MKDRTRIILISLIAVTLVGLTVFFVCEAFGPSEIKRSTWILEREAVDHQEDHASPTISVTETVSDLPVDTPVVELGVKSVILMIGDGMGAEHRQAAQLANVGITGHLAMDTLPVQGELMTSSADRTITDSAASATAMATGYKTNNKVIGLDANLNLIPSILEEAQVLGKSVGLITTTHLAHATPAGFASHVESRYAYEDIAEQLSDAGVNVLLGGGERFFQPPEEEGCFSGPGVRTDGRDLIQEMIDGGYTLVCDGASLADIDLASTRYLLGFFGDAALSDPYSPTLAEMTAVAIAILAQDPDGFFLMVEEGQIDWAGHDNNAEKVIADTLALDEAVEVAKEYIEGAGDSLLIVTADHETGGMSVGLSPSGKSDEEGPFAILGGGTFYVNWATGGHTAANVPFTASGPMADQLAGVHENTYLHELILEAFCAFADIKPVLAEGEDPCGAPMIEIMGNGRKIANGDMISSPLDGTDFGAVELGGDPSPGLFTITNSGEKDLYLTGSPLVEITGSHPGDFSVNLLPNSPLAFKDGSTTFEISFHPKDRGLRTAVIIITTSDLTQNPYTFVVQGTGVGEGD